MTAANAPTSRSRRADALAKDASPPKFIERERGVD
jgi:hypothetical protein